MQQKRCRRPNTYAYSEVFVFIAPGTPAVIDPQPALDPCYRPRCAFRVLYRKWSEPRDGISLVAELRDASSDVYSERPVPADAVWHCISKMSQ
jgi:hypothetical protein